MTKKVINLKVFERKEVPGVFFQPRIEWWYRYNKAQRALAEKYQNMSLIELFDHLDVSIRYFSYLTGLPDAVGAKNLSQKGIETKEKIEGGKRTIITSIPKGEIVREEKLCSDGTWRIVRHPIQNAQDIEKAIWLFKNTTYYYKGKF